MLVSHLKINYGNLLINKGYSLSMTSGLRLFRLTSFRVERRTGEIGIRKVLGASVSSIFFLLSQEFLMWALLANIIAWPLAYIFMNDWLQNFAYKIQLQFWIVLLAALMEIINALRTVCNQALKSVFQNPMVASRYK
jgi:putative ABC transport system permease protein